MGACMSGQSSETRAKESAEKAASKKIEEAHIEEQQADQAIKKLLLLGAGESGKSTLSVKGSRSCAPRPASLTRSQVQTDDYAVR